MEVTYYEYIIRKKKKLRLLLLIIVEIAVLPIPQIALSTESLVNEKANKIQVSIKSVFLSKVSKAHGNVIPQT